METRSNQILVGSIVLGLLAALAVFIIWLSQVGDGAEEEIRRLLPAIGRRPRQGQRGDLPRRSGRADRIDQPRAGQPPVHPGAHRHRRRDAGAPGHDRDDPRRRLHRRLPDPARSARARARPASVDHGDTLSRAEPAVRMPLRLSGDPDPARRARAIAQHRARAARTRLDADRAADRALVRPQPGIDRRHPRQSRGGQPQASPNARPRSPRPSPRRGSPSSRPESPPTGWGSSPRQPSGWSTRTAGR